MTRKKAHIPKIFAIVAVKVEWLADQPGPKSEPTYIYIHVTGPDGNNSYLEDFDIKYLALAQREIAKELARRKRVRRLLTGKKHAPPHLPWSLPARGRRPK